MWVPLIFYLSPTLLTEESERRKSLDHFLLHIIPFYLHQTVSYKHILQSTRPSNYVQSWVTFFGKSKAYGFFLQPLVSLRRNRGKIAIISTFVWRPRRIHGPGQQGGGRNRISHLSPEQKSKATVLGLLFSFVHLTAHNHKTGIHWSVPGFGASTDLCLRASGPTSVVK